MGGVVRRIKENGT